MAAKARYPGKGLCPSDVAIRMGFMGWYCKQALGRSQIPKGKHVHNFWGRVMRVSHQPDTHKLNAPVLGEGLLVRVDGVLQLALLDQAGALARQRLGDGLVVRPQLAPALHRRVAVLYALLVVALLEVHRRPAQIRVILKTDGFSLNTFL